MTSWQWRVVIALCKLVNDVLEYNKDIPINPPSLYVIRKALEIDKKEEEVNYNLER